MFLWHNVDRAAQQESEQAMERERVRERDSVRVREVARE